MTEKNKLVTVVRKELQSLVDLLDTDDGGPAAGTSSGSVPARHSTASVSQGQGTMTTVPRVRITSKHSRSSSCSKAEDTDGGLQKTEKRKITPRAEI